ncbi:hypothetical protein BX600DRAFT_227698 [Xylariales sp. PMI_506]|nr:hypothetical protein BX600DRAFT_227698 [Xylariales sp. PMI_506]
MDEVGFIVQDRLYTMRQYIDSWVCVSRALYYWGFSYHLLAAWSFLNFFHTLALWLSWVRATRRTAAYLRDHPLNHHNRRRRRHYNNIGNGTVDTDSDSDDDDDLGGDIRSRYGVLRAVVDLAAVARDVIGIDIHGMSDRQIEKRLDAARAGIVVMHRDDRVTSWDWASEYRATATGFSSGGDVEDVLPRQTAFSPHQES